MSSPDFDIPLLSRETYSTFSRKIDGSVHTGRVYPQRRSLADNRHHPEMFYVEWPSESADFREIHAPTLASICGYQAPPRQAYSTHPVAAILSSMHTIPVSDLIHAARPRS